MNNALTKNYYADLDILKGIATIAVVLYHLSGTILPYGYLGVEVFLVISGYLMMTGVLRAMANNSFSYFKQITNRLLRLWPSVIAIALISLAIGLFMMLPDDFENVSQSAIASTAFANNILAAITTKDYWNSANVFKPLMHTWYLGVLMQAYVVFLALVAICNKITKNNTTAVKWLTVAVTAVSLALFLLPNFAQHQKFYYLPFRLFEITSGALIAFIPISKQLSASTKTVRLIKWVCGIGITLLLTIPHAFIPDALKLLTTVVLTIVYVYAALVVPAAETALTKPFTFLGKNSLCIYLSHQCIVAFFYYNFVEDLTVVSFVAFLAVVAAGSLLLYWLVEKPIDTLIRKNKRTIALVITSVAAVIVCALSGVVYLRAGVVYDVPELDITTDDAKRGIHSAYCDRVYKWNGDFTDSDKVKVLIIGDSYGRDFANVLSESSIAEDVEISYVFNKGDDYENTVLQRVDDADYVFYAGYGTVDIHDFCKQNIPAEKLWVVGNKSFGISNGMVYKHRHAADYYTKTQAVSPDVIAFNNQMKEQYKDHYIDMMSYVLQGDNRVRVFTDDGKFISQDCRHLTRAGAQFYAACIDLTWLIHPTE